tara:strand:+ start:109 stop:513 length:405 start_codon:yes stop_codon:yes gene_type:complete
MAKLFLTKAQKRENGLKNGLSNARGKIKLLQSKAKVYSPSVGNSLLSAGGGFVAGCVASGQYIPPQIAGVSTPLLVGGLLASYGIFSGSDDKTGNDMISKVAINVGNGMLSFWAGTYALQMTSARLQQQQSDIA